jgi:hypothetical protein
MNWWTNCGIPSSRPTITPSALWTTVDKVRERVRLAVIEIARLHDPRVDFNAVACTRPPNIADLRPLEAKAGTVFRVRGDAVRLLYAVGFSTWY